MARYMAARFHEFDPWQESGVAVKEPIAQRWRVPVFTDDLRTWVPRPRDFVVAALHQQFGPRKEFMVSGVVRVEMRADQKVNIVWLQPDGGESVEHVIFRVHFYLQTHRGLRSWRMFYEAPGKSRINQNVRPVVGLNQISRHGNA